MPRALNTGTCIQQGDLFYSAGQHRKKLGEVLEKMQVNGLISGLQETFVKRYIVERTNKAEIRPEELSEKTESCR